MKSFVFSNAQGTFNIDFKTDHLDGLDNFTVHDILLTSPSGSVTEDGIVRTGLNYRRLPYTVAGFELFATNNNLNLKEIDWAANQTTDLVTGASDDLDITTSSLPNGSDGVGYSQTVAVTGGFKEYTFAVTTGSLPTGLSLDTRTGTISGTPSGAQTANFTVTVTDITEQVNSQALSIQII